MNSMWTAIVWLVSTAAVVASVIRVILFFAFGGLRARVDEDERAAHEADLGNGLIEQLLQSVASLLGLKLFELLLDGIEVVFYVLLAQPLKPLLAPSSLGMLLFHLGFHLFMYCEAFPAQGHSQEGASSVC